MFHYNYIYTMLPTYNVASLEQNSAPVDLWTCKVLSHLDLPNRLRYLYIILVVRVIIINSSFPQSIAVSHSVLLLEKALNERKGSIADIKVNL